MTIKQLIEWLRKEFPQASWFETSLFERKCVAAQFGANTRIYVSSKPKGTFGIDLEMKNNGFGRQLESLDQVKDTVIECMNIIDPSLLNSIQERLI